jgi:hypothetical protein
MPDISSSEPDEQPAKLPSTASPKPVMNTEDLRVDDWEPDVEPSMLKKLFTGWRLLFLLLGIVVLYTFLRGRQDYSRFKNWRGRGIAAKATELDQQGNKDQAQEDMKQALLLAPQDPTVLKALVDFCRRHDDPMELYALRQYTGTGQAKAAEWERLCYLAKKTGHPEMLPIKLLSLWAAVEVKELSVGQLILSSEWLAARGRQEPAMKRLLEGQALFPEDKELALAIESQHLAGPDAQGIADAIDGSFRKVESLLSESSLDMEKRTGLLRNLAARMVSPPFRPLLTDARRNKLVDLYEALASAEGMPAGLKHKLTAATIRATVPAARDATVRETLALHPELSFAERHPIMTWLSENGLYNEMLAACEAEPKSLGDKDWFVSRLDALFATKQYAKAEELLSVKTQPLSELKRQFYLYRLKLAQNPTKELQLEYRNILTKLASSSDFKEVVQIGQVAEKIGDKALGYNLYLRAADDQASGLQARLGMVRCLDGDAERVQDLIRALEEVLKAWPQLDDARNDLIYVRLLVNQATPEDFRYIEAIAKQSTWLLSFQVTAALAQLRQEKPEEALKLLQSSPVPWEQAQKGWQAVYACVLGANGKIADGKAIVDKLDQKLLRVGERELIAKYLK